MNFGFSKAFSDKPQNTYLHPAFVLMLIAFRPALEAGFAVAALIDFLSHRPLLAPQKVDGGLPLSLAHLSSPKTLVSSPKTLV